MAAPTGFVNRTKGKTASAAGSVINFGKGTNEFQAEGNISVNTTAAVSAATNTLQALMAAAVLAPNALDMNGRTVYLEAWGTFAANAASKSLTVSIGAVTYNTGTTTQSGGGWRIEAHATRSGSKTQEIMFDSTLGTTKGGVQHSAGTNDDTATISISVQCTDASAAQSNVIQYGQIIGAAN